jgi:hypothetical protein
MGSTSNKGQTLMISNFDFVLSLSGHLRDGDSSGKSGQQIRTSSSRQNFAMQWLRLHNGNDIPLTFS